MKKTLLITLLLTAAIFFTYYGGQAITPTTATNSPRIFFVDRRLHKLISLDFPNSSNTEKTARKLVSELIEGRDENEEILRLIPNNHKAIRVSVKKDCACVDLSSDIIPKLSKNPETERLFIYQFVNSLTSIDGINSVTFTINGKIQKKFLGFLDLREIFTPDYDI